eukprot:TRINITY_DN515_c1_g1_i1.p1 TRINITY_DN515_c1_g1~~TRINITY_DN515_c1_g1_i1.p1  ORF type:complete len:380 (+),score=77.89 TRINITY_DN515_c1_g1_i1:42-1142(+)
MGSTTSTPQELKPYAYNLIFLGDSQVGKTTIFYQILRVTPSGEDTFGPVAQKKLIEVEERSVEVTLWDHTQLLVSNPKLCSPILPFGDGILLVFDVTNEESFRNIEMWYSEVETHGKTPFPLIVLVGNKTDLEEKRVISTEEGMEMANRLNCPYFELSATEDTEQVDRVFDHITQELVATRPKEKIITNSPPRPPESEKHVLHLLGSQSAGKTTIINQIAGLPLETKNMVNICKKSFDIKSRTVQVTIVEDSLKIPVATIMKEDAVLLVYDVTDEDSFQAIETWCTELERYNKVPLIFIIGNKIDIREDGMTWKRVISTEEGMEMASRFNCPYFELSATEDTEQVVRVLESITEELSTRIPKSQST